LSHFRFDSDDHSLETLWEVGSQEKELWECGKLSKSISTAHNPAPKRNQDWSENGFNTKFMKKNEYKTRKPNTLQLKSPRTTAVNQTRNNSRDEHTDRKKAHEGSAEHVVEK